MIQNYQKKTSENEKISRQLTELGNAVLTDRKFVLEALLIQGNAIRDIRRLNDVYAVILGILLGIVGSLIIINFFK